MTYPMQPNPSFQVGAQDAPTGQPPVVQPPVPQPPAGAPVPQPPAAPPAPASTQPRYFTEEEVTAIRQQEKDKLYGRIQQAEQRAQSVEERLAAIETERQQQADAEAARLAAEAEAARKAAEEEMSAKELISAREAEIQRQLAAMQAEREQERAMLAKERALAELQAYINQRAREESTAQTIAPELIDLITGNNKEEVEASIATLRAKTEQLVAAMTSAQQAQMATQQGVSTAGYAAVGPMDTEPGQRRLTPEEIQKMPMSEWARIRGQVIGAASQTNHGLYG